MCQPFLYWPWNAPHATPVIFSLTQLCTLVQFQWKWCSEGWNVQVWVSSAVSIFVRSISLPATSCGMPNLYPLGACVLQSRGLLPSLTKKIPIQTCIYWSIIILTAEVSYMVFECEWECELESEMIGGPLHHSVMKVGILEFPCGLYLSFSPQKSFQTYHLGYKPFERTGGISLRAQINPCIVRDNE